MRRFTFFVFLLILLLAGGGLTSMLIANGGQVLPMFQQVGTADASPTAMLPWKANQFFLLVGFLLFNLVGIAATIGIVIWLIDWGIKRSKADAANTAASASADAAKANPSP